MMDNNLAQHFLDVDKETTNWRQEPQTTTYPPNVTAADVENSFFNQRIMHLTIIGLPLACCFIMGLFWSFGVVGPVKLKFVIVHDFSTFFENYMTVKNEANIPQSRRC